MLGIEDYGSDDENDRDQSEDATTDVRLSKTTLVLPPPSNSSKKTTQVPPSKPKRAPKKITISLPELPAGPDDDIDEEKPPAKKPRLGAGAGSSSLLAMLPAPKQTQPTAPQPERILGAGRGPGLIFNSSRPSQLMTSSSPLLEGKYDEMDDAAHGLPSVSPDTQTTSAISLRPTSLGKGRSNISVEEGKAPSKKAPPNLSSAPVVDLFSLGLYLHSQLSSVN
jgi:proline-rich protein PRCC